MTIHDLKNCKIIKFVEVYRKIFTERVKEDPDVRVDCKKIIQKNGERSIQKSKEKSLFNREISIQENGESFEKEIREIHSK